MPAWRTTLTFCWGKAEGGKQRKQGTKNQWGMKRCGHTRGAVGYPWQCQGLWVSPVLIRRLLCWCIPLFLLDKLGDFPLALAEAQPGEARPPAPLGGDQQHLQPLRLCHPVSFLRATDATKTRECSKHRWLPIAERQPLFSNPTWGFTPPAGPNLHSLGGAAEVPLPAGWGPAYPTPAVRDANHPPARLPLKLPNITLLNTNHREVFQI